MKRLTPSIIVSMYSLVILSGCAINDPNKNDKIRYSMAHIHANRVLTEAGSNLESHYPDYSMMTFRRDHYDRSTHVVHVCELYDFLKVSPEPGPERFVIAYDKVTRKTYLRANLRSNENLERLD